MQPSMKGNLKTDISHLLGENNLEHFDHLD